MFWLDVSAFAIAKLVSVTDHFLSKETRDALKMDGNESKRALETLNPIIKQAILAFPSNDHLRHSARKLKEALNHLSTEGEVGDLKGLADAMVAKGGAAEADAFWAKLEVTNVKALGGKHDNFRGALDHLSNSLTMGEILKGGTSTDIKILGKVAKAFSKEMPEYANIHNVAAECHQGHQRLEALRAARESVGDGGLMSPKFESALNLVTRSAVKLQELLPGLPAGAMKTCRDEVQTMVGVLEKESSALASNVIGKYVDQVEASAQKHDHLMKSTAVQEWLDISR